MNVIIFFANKTIPLHIIASNRAAARNNANYKIFTRGEYYLFHAYICSYPIGYFSVFIIRD